jgi:hypothetical protein
VARLSSTVPPVILHRQKAISLGTTLLRTPAPGVT